MASPRCQRFCAAVLLLASLLLLQFAWLCTAPSNAEGNALTTVKSMLRDPLGRLSSWNPDLVDPCSSWQGVTCINKRVVSVNLPMFGLSGTLSSAIAVLTELQTLVLQDNNITGFLPSELGNLANLTTLKLQNNSFIGPIPSTLGNLTQLKTLDLSSNNLTGQIPVALFHVSTFNFSGNNLDCGPNQTDPCQSSSNSPSINNSTSTSKPLIGALIGAPIAIVLAVIAGILLCVCCRRNKDVFVDVPAEDDFKIAFGQLKKFSWRELQIATNNFSDEIGAGAFAKVYKGVLNDGTEIAVKRLLSTLTQDAGEASFLQEIEMISVAVHRNLLHLIGFCITPLERILVYPYMPNKSLASRLRARQKGEPGLDWNARKKISLGAARGLEYLHHHCNPKIIHRDVKAANVFLNKDYEAVVGDFGLAKLIDPMNTHVTTVVAGTMGHIAPEYLSTGKSSEKTDVFGYGVMLLELVTGQKAIDFSRLEEEDDVLLLDHVKKLQHEKKLDMIVDPDLLEYDVKEVEQMIQVALLCSQPTPEERPNMAEVVRMLSGEGLAERWEEWQQVEVIRRQEYDAMPQRLAEWVEDSSVNQEAVQLSSAR